MFSKVRIQNCLCSFQIIRIVLEVTNNFFFTFQDFTTSKLVLLSAQVPSDLPILLVSIPPTIAPSWNHHIDNYVYGIFGFTNKYVEKNGTILIFHHDDLHILKEIKSFLEMNGYEIHFRWAIFNFLLWMNNEIKGKLVIPLLNFIYITFHSIELYWIESYCSQSCRFN